MMMAPMVGLLLLVGQCAAQSTSLLLETFNNAAAFTATDDMGASVPFFSDGSSDYM